MPPRVVASSRGIKPEVWRSSSQAAGAPAGAATACPRPTGGSKGRGHTGAKPWEVCYEGSAEGRRLGKV